MVCEFLGVSKGDMELLQVRKLDIIIKLVLEAVSIFKIQYYMASAKLRVESAKCRCRNY